MYIIILHSILSYILTNLAKFPSYLCSVRSEYSKPNSN